MKKNIDRQKHSWGAAVRPLLFLAISVPAVVIFASSSGCSESNPSRGVEALRPVDLRTGTRFLPTNSFDAPLIQRVQLPTPGDGDAVWGATGRDDRGRIYVGVSSHGDGRQTAHLYQ